MRSQGVARFRWTREQRSFARNQQTIRSHTADNAGLQKRESGINRCRPPVTADLPIKMSGGDGAKVLKS